MYLKSLSMRGFKSFAEKTILEFEPGITAIVGPNGSGKSNITDAILWVLGEQSPRSLRGSSMEDVIFAGSSVKSPLGIAEVSLCLDNLDKIIPIEFSEVIISRRVLRSGESEYRINNTLCRLIDILELLSDTGLGREMHSVVSQGKLEEVLNYKPEERRMLIDEAAGVLKYRKRKEKAARKIISVEQKLVRVKDILREVRQQLNPLRRQADQAEMFNRLSTELRNLEINLTVVELKELQLSWDVVLKQEDELSKQIADLKEELIKEENELKKLKAEINKVDSTADNLREQIGKLENIHERLNGNILLIKEKIRNFEISLDKFLYEKDNFNTDRQKKSIEISKVQEEKEEAGKNLEIIFSNLSVKEEELIKLNQKIKEIGSNLSGIQTRIIECRKDYNHFEEEQNVLSNAVMEINNKLGILNTKEQNILLRKKELEEEFSIQENKKRYFDLELDGLKNSMINCKSSNASCLSIDDVDKTRDRFVFKIKQEIDLIKSNLSGRDRELEEILNNKSRLVEKLNEIKNNKLNVKDKVLNLKENINEFNRELDKHKNIRNQFLRDENDLKRSVNELKIKQASLSERKAYLEKQLDASRKVFIDHNTTIEEKERNIVFSRVQVEESNKLLKSVAILVDFCEKTLDRLKNFVKDEKGTSANIEELIEKKENITVMLRAEIFEQGEKLHHLGISKAQLELRVNGLVQKLIDEFDVPLEKALSGYSFDVSKDEMSLRVKGIKSKIFSLGPVNPIAIDEYKSLEERFNLLTEQIEDLNKAQKMLKDVIEEINNKIESTFLEVFETVNKNFKIVFSCLFEGGKAELTITDPDNLLETGIEMEVNPCGKRLQKMSLLSGGEKSLTALAFLFAIHKTRPSPFYILDEVEAALDDTNIQRFIALLDKLKDKTQFLIVTHQKRTMEIADLLYGTTMQADGMSKLVSQKLHQEEEVCAIS